MSKDIVKGEIEVNEMRIGVMRVNGMEYISLTDLARWANKKNPRMPVQNWMRNKDVISYLGLWEELRNPQFKRLEFEAFKNEAGSNKFSMTPQEWIRSTRAIGFISKRGRTGGGTYAHSDIALEFASWLSPEFKLYVIQEFERLKKDEAYRYRVDWQANRLLSKMNYLLQTEAIRDFIVPDLSERQKRFAYADEADVLNVALFGMTAKEWREKNPELAKTSNIRDHTDLLHLVILSNLENANAEMIKLGLSQEERIVRLNDSAKVQGKVLAESRSFEGLKVLEEGVKGDDDDEGGVTNEE